MDPKERVETVAKTKMGAQEEKASPGDESAPGADYRVTQAQVDAVIESWPPAPKKVAETTVERYGPPNEATPSLLIWHHNGPWKRTIITSDETAHDFPTPHTDYISQTISYDVPVEKLPELAKFDGSLIVYRTAGQVTFSCDTEETNLIGANLMHDIVTGKRRVDEARKEYAEQTAAWAMNRRAPYTEGIQFPLPDEGGTGHLDEAMMKGAAARQTVEKLKDKLGLGGQSR